MTAGDAACRALAWRERNPRAWAYMEALAEADARAGRRISVAYIVERCRSKDFATSDGEPFRIDNTYRPAFARMMVKEHPEWGRLIELRPAKCDGLV